MAYKFVVEILTHSATLLDNNYGTEKTLKIMFNFIFYFNRKYVTTWRCPFIP